MNTESTPSLVAVVQPPIVRPVSFRGYDFDANRVVAVAPVNSHSTGNLSCDWQYGVRVSLEGASIIILSEMRESAWTNRSATREECKGVAEKMREELLKIIWPRQYGCAPVTHNP